MSTSTLVPLLSEWTAKYSLFMSNSKGFNHVTHGMIALQRLGADPPRIQRYVDTYGPKLQLRSAFNEEANQQKKLGGGNSFFSIFEEYEQRLQKNNGSVELLISQNLPSLAPGIGGGAFHGLIHVGYGYAAQSPQMVLDGLAFMQQTSLPPVVSNDQPPRATETRPSRSILEVVNEIRSDKTISEFIQDELTKREWTKLNSFRFGYMMGIVMGRFGNELVNWANAVEIPSDVSLAKWLANSAITVYAASEPKNDFYLLHGVTSAWGLLQVFSLLKNHDNERAIARHFLCALLAVYVTQGTPILHLDGIAADHDGEGLPSWDVLIERTLAKDFDEHVFKIVQSCHDLDLDNSDLELTRLYKKAASVALDYPLFFHPLPKVQ